MKKLLSITVLLLIVAFSFAQQNVNSTSSGIIYSIIKDSIGDNANIYDWVKLKLITTTDNDSIIDIGFHLQKPIEIEIKKSVINKGGFEESLLLLSTGDSAHIKILESKIFTTDKPRPSSIKKGAYITFKVKVISISKASLHIKDKIEAFNKRLEEHFRKPSVINQALIDEKLLHEYFKDKKIKSQSAEHGLYYQIIKEGKGAIIEIGDSVTVNYSLRILNSKTIIDSSKKYGQPFSFCLGIGEVIPGWEIGISKLTVGTKAKLYLPSTLGYGDKQTGSMLPPNSILVFEIEVLKSN
jgi:FKBP-type peptidyl-prolyl cis-trans isomerase